MYVDGVSYMLQSLPAELDEPELMVLRRSLPPPLLAGGSCQVVLGASGQPAHPPSTGRSILRRAVQALVIQVILVAQVLLPYLMSLARLAMETERKYKVTEKFIISTIGLADFCGRQSINITEAIRRMGGPRSQQALVGWMLEDISSGVSDGIGEGLARLGAKDR